ncbi:hypothetical protein [Vibrio harveyi]
MEDTRGILENDRVRNPIIERIRAVADAARNTTKRVRDALQGFGEKIRAEQQRKPTLTEQCEQLDRASKQLDESAPAVGKAIQQEKSLARQNRRSQSIGFSR